MTAEEKAFGSKLKRCETRDPSLPMARVKPGGGLGRILIAVALAVLLGGCRNLPADRSPATTEAAAIKEAMRRKNEIVYFSSPQLDASKPVLLLLHGATSDPLEMREIIREWRGQYNVLLFAYNFKKPITTIAANLAREMAELRTNLAALNARPNPMAAVTVVTYSYSAAVFRKAVLLASDSTLFSEVSLIQLVPTAGGSFLARGMRLPITSFLVSLASNFSTVENPYGRIAAELWGEAGTRKFDGLIPPQRVQTILIEGDRHSLAHFPDREIQRRYTNGIGTNVIVIPKDIGATHEYFPTEPVALGYLRRTMETNPAGWQVRNRPEGLDSPASAVR